MISACLLLFDFCRNRPVLFYAFCWCSTFVGIDGSWFLLLCGCSAFVGVRLLWVSVFVVGRLLVVSKGLVSGCFVVVRL